MSKNPEDKKLNICFMTGSMATGGAERVITTLANEFVQKGHKVLIICLGRTEQKTIYNLNDKVPVIFTGSQEQISFITRKYRQYKRVKSRLSYEKPNVIIGFQNYINVQAVIYGKRNQIPVVISERSFPQKNLRGFLGFGLLCKLIYSFADAAVFQTNEQKKFYNMAWRRRDTIIMNPLRCAAAEIPFYHVRDEVRIIGSVGRLEKTKNYPLLIKTFSRLKKRFPQLRLVIWGTGGMQEELYELVKLLGIEEAVSFPGETGDIFGQMIQFDIFAFSSMYEGIPNALIEAMCVGLPCVSTDFEGGGAGRLVQNGVNGLLVKNNDEAMFEQALTKLITDAELRKRLSENAKAMRKETEIENVSKQWLDIISKVL